MRRKWEELELPKMIDATKLCLRCESVTKKEVKVYQDGHRLKIVFIVLYKTAIVDRNKVCKEADVKSPCVMMNFPGRYPYKAIKLNLPQIVPFL